MTILEGSIHHREGENDVFKMMSFACDYIILKTLYHCLPLIKYNNFTISY